jgi:hypothetical protein
VALWLLAGFLSAVGVLILGQLLVRLSFLESTAHGSLRALGMRRRQLVAAGLGRAAAIGVGGGGVAVVLAFTHSPRPSLSAACDICCRTACPLRRSTRCLSCSTPISARQAGRDALASRVARAGPFIVLGAQTPAGLVNFGQLPNLPMLLGSGMALSGLALATIAHLLITRSGGAAAISPSCARSASPAARSAAPRRGRRARLPGWHLRSGSQPASSAAALPGGSSPAISASCLYWTSPSTSPLS